MTSLFDSFSTNALEICQPLFSTIELGLSCQFKCHHCYNFDRRDPNSKVLAQSLNEMLTRDEVLDVIKQLAEAGTLHLNFSGGEPLLNPHIKEYISYAKLLACLPRLKTNGALLTKSKTKELYEAGLEEVDISLYGYDEESYFNFTGKREFSLVIQGIANAKEVGLRVTVSMILHKGNYKHISKMTKILEELDVDFNYSDEITDRYDKTKNDDVEIGSKEMKELLSGEHSDLFMFKNEDTSSFQCSCARSVCGISYKGDVYPCIGAPIIAGSIREKSFSDIWKNSSVFKRIRGLERSDFKACVDCSVAEFCDRSSGTAYVNTGDYTGCDTRYLENAKLRKEHHKKKNK